MARSLVFTNSNSEVITFERSPYLITNIEGLGIPSVEVQEQRSPFIDGTTEIDNVIEARDIVMTVSIIAPNDFSNIDTYRRDIIKKLNPKLNAGTIIYTTEGGDSYRIVGTPTSVVFRGKVYGEPFQECQIIFHCHDPYWTAVNSTTVDIGLLITGDDTTIYDGAVINPPDLLQDKNGVYRCFFNKSDAGTSDAMQYYSSNLTSWTSNTITTTKIKTLRAIQLINDSFLVVGVRVSDDYLVMLTSSNGTTWSAVSVITSAISSSPCLFQRADGTIVLAYINSSGNVKIKTSADNGSTWSAETTAYSGVKAYSIDIIQGADDRYYLPIVFKAPDFYLNISTSSDLTTWSTPEQFTASETAVWVRIMQSSNELFRVFYGLADGNTKQAISSDGYTWGTGGSATNASGASAPIEDDNGFIMLAYSVGGGSIALKYQSTPLTIVCDYDVPCQIRFNGPAVNPMVENILKGEYVRIVNTLAANDYMIIDTGLKTVRLIKDDIEINGNAYLDIKSTFFTLINGDNYLSYFEATASTTATATVTYRERYAGI